MNSLVRCVLSLVWLTVSVPLMADGQREPRDNPTVATSVSESSQYVKSASIGKLLRSWDELFDAIINGMKPGRVQINSS